MSDGAPVSRPMSPAPTVSRTGIPAGGKRYRLQADDETRDRMARELRLVSLDRFVADLTVERASADGIRVFGQVDASLVQACILTLADVPAEISETLDLTYSPHVRDTMEDGEIVLDPNDEGPEPMDGESLNLAEIAREHLVLAIDPYPQAPGAELDSELATDAEASPFAALAALKSPEGH